MLKMKFLSIIVISIFVVKSKTIHVGVKWNKHSKIFESIPGSSTYESERQNIILKSRERETHNFSGESLNLSYYQDDGFFHFYDNDTKASGICGDIWTILSDFLNFTLVLNRSNELSLGVSLKNKTYTGILEDARLNKTDIVPKVSVYITRSYAVEFSPTMWITRIFAYGQWKPNRAWMFTLLSKDVWLTIAAFIIIMSIASIMMQRILIHYRGRKMKSENFCNHLFYSVATLSNQTSNSGEQTGSGSNMFNLAINIFAYLILSAYNSHLIYSMSTESFEAPFNDLQTLFDNTNYHVVVFKGSPAHLAFASPFTMPIFHRIRKSPRLIVLTDMNDLYEKVCTHPNKYVLFDTEESVAVQKAHKCRVTPVGTRYYLKGISSGISRRVINRKSLYIGIMKLREYGLLDAIKKRYMSSNSKEHVIRHADIRDIDIEHVCLLFGIFILGMIASIIIFIAEIIVVTLENRKPYQR